MFRNLTFFRYPATLDLTALDALLPAHALKPVGPLEWASAGFIPPFGGDSTALTHRCGDAVWLSMGTQHRMLPAAVLHAALAEKLAEIEAGTGHRLGGRARKQLKDDLLHELLPRAFVKPGRVDMLLDLQHHYIAVDTASRKVGEGAVSLLRAALGSFPALHAKAEVAPRSVLTGWLYGEPLPPGMALGDEVELKDAMDGGAIVRCQYQELVSDEIAMHLEAGKQVTRLQVVLGDRVQFTVGEDLAVRKLRLLDGALDQLENTDIDSVQAELAARFSLFSGEAAALFQVLEQAFHISKAEG